MKFFHYIFVLIFCTSLHASFYREGLIDPASPLAVLDPVKRSEIERLTQNLRFFGDLNSRPAQDVYVHYQAIQNLLVWPTSPTTALSWMLFPISPLPTINPNNIGVSDPLGKMTPEQLGKLIGVIAEYKEDSESFYLDSLFETDRSAQLQKLYQIFTTAGKVSGFVESHNEEELKKFYRYALVDGVSKYVHRNMSPIDEDLHLTEAQQADCVAHPYKLVIEAFKKSSSHLLEIPGTEILREPNETYFREAELETELQKKYGGFSYRGLEKLRIQATVDMLWKSAQGAPDQTLQLLSYYGWRKFGEQISDVILASSAINAAQKSGLEHVLATPYTKADYQELVERVKASEDIDGLMAELNEGQRNLLLYGNARYAQIITQNYGNVRVEHGGKYLAFANCAEMSLFNLTYLAQLQEQEFGLELNPDLLPQGSPLQLFWQELAEEDFGTTPTRNSWTQAICRRAGVVYRKGGGEQAPWAEGHATAHWAELNPGILNQFRTLFHLAGKPDEALALTYASSTEETVEAAALRLSQLLGGKPDALSLSQLFYDEPTDEELSFEIIVKSDLKNISGKRDWYGAFDILKNAQPLAVWHVNTDHSYIQLTSKKTNVFALEKSFSNPYVIGQMEVLNHVCWHNGIEDTLERAAFDLSQQQFPLKLEALKTSLQMFEIFFTHANLSNEQFRRNFLNWLTQQDESFHQYAHKIMYGVADIDEGRDLRCMSKGSSGFNLSRQTQKLLSFNALFQHVNADYRDLEINRLGKIALNYRNHFSDVEVTEEDTCLPENRHTFLHINIAATNCGSLCLNMCATDAIRFLSEYSFPQLSNIYFDFDKDCQSEGVKEIARFLPVQVRELNLSSMNTDHLVDFICNISLPNLIIHIDIDGIYRINKYTGKQYNLPSTQQELAYQLLFPLAKFGRIFDPEVIQLSTDDDLEPVYERLRIVAALHKQPEFLMIEDGAADF